MTDGNDGGDEKSMVQIITDSAADFEPQELTQLQIACIPLSVNFGGREYRENLELSKAEFYRMLTTEAQFPTTSQPSPVEFEQAIRGAQERGMDAVVITLSSALSGTYQGALSTKERLEYHNCEIVDSLMATGGQRLLVEYAVRLRDEGRSAGEIAQAVRALRPRLSLYASIDTLEYLRRGGRISGAAAALATATHIKPIIHVSDEGGIEVPAKVLGKQNGFRYLLKKVAQEPPDPDFPFYVMYAHLRDNTDILADMLRETGVPIPPENVIDVGAAIGSHIGPKGFGFVYVRK